METNVNVFHAMWDRLQSELTQRTSWGRSQIIDLMNKIEKEEMRKRIENVR